MLFLFTSEVLGQGNHNLNSAEADNESIELPRWGIKTNLLYDATTTLNLGFEFRIGGRTSLDLSGNWNPWTFDGNRKWKHYLIQPEFRWWPKETFRRHFFGIHGHYALYNISNLPHGPFTEYMRDHRFEGRLAGAGVSYGYRWNFNSRWALEATIGVGYAYLDYDKFECLNCGEFIEHRTKHRFGPTKAGITLIYGIGGKRASKPQPTTNTYIIFATPQPVSEVVPYEPKLLPSFVTADEMAKPHSESERLLLDFKVNDAHIALEFRDNAAELYRIDRMIEKVVGNPEAKISGLTITGYSSPDGTYIANKILSERRAQALKNHIMSVHNLPAHLMTVLGAGEDWAALDSLVARSDMPEKEHVLAIIRGTDVFEGREKKLMTLADGAPYRWMKAKMFPQLRHVVCRVDYTITPVGDMEALNAAAAAILRGDVVAATEHLGNVQEYSDAYWNNAGVLAWLLGNKAEAAECFTKAGVRGAANVTELGKHILSTD